MASAITPLANITTTGTPTTISVTSISSAYRDIYFVFTTSSTSGTPYITYRINGDTSSNYDAIHATGNGGSASTGQLGSQNTGYLNLTGTLSSSEQNTFIFTIFDYAQTKYKSMLLRNNRAGDRASMEAHIWRNTSAMNSIVFTISSSSFAAGTTLAIYGVSA